MTKPRSTYGAKNPLVRRLIDRRLELGMTQAQVAARADMRRATIRASELGNHEGMPLHMFEAWARALGFGIRFYRCD